LTKPLPGPSLAELERALDEAVSAIVAYRENPPEDVARAQAGKSGKLRSTSGADLLDTDREVLLARSIAASPVEAGLKYAINELGKFIHAQVGDGGMIEVAERVAGLDDGKWQRRMAPIDSAWNGIGTWYS